MIADANVTSTAGVPVADEPAADQADAETAPQASLPQAPSSQRKWSVPKSPVTREDADRVGRLALQAGTRGVTFLAAVSRYTLGMLRGLVRSIEKIPAALRLFVFVGVLMLLGVVGAVTQHGTLGLACLVVVVPVCSMILGALGQRWYSGLSTPTLTPADSPVAEAPSSQAPSSESQRALAYVDKKLAVAFNAFGADRQQHAMIALFQAKTAVELTLGTEQDADNSLDAYLGSDMDTARPRIRAGSASRTSVHESNSLASS